MDEAQAGIKITERNIINLRYPDNTTLMEESEEERKSLLRKVKEESEKAGLKHDIHWGTRVSFPSGFLSVYAQQWDCWIIRHVYFQFFKESPHCSP